MPATGTNGHGNQTKSGQLGHMPILYMVFSWKWVPLKAISFISKQIWFELRCPFQNQLYSLVFFFKVQS